MRTFAVSLFLASCGQYDQATYESDFADLACDRYEACDLLAAFNYETMDECLAGYEVFSEEQAATCDKFHDSRARKCLKAFEDLSCETLEGLTNLPDPCNSICE
jgi:hypothetical protein